MSERRSASSSLSSQVILYLLGNGHSQVDIARMLRVSEGFISLVKSRDRSLTIDHLELISESLSVPLGALLLAVTQPRANTNVDKEFFALTERIMKQADAATRAIMRRQTTSSR